MKTTAILSYHKVGSPPAGSPKTWFYVPEETLISQLNYFKENGWTVIAPATFLDGLVEPDVLPERSALLTFDDGYRSMLTVTLPILLRFGYPAVLFAPTGFIGGRNTFDPHEPEEEICGWEELKELERRGVSVQSHGVSHRTFSDLDPASQEEELLRSKISLETGLEKPVEVFAYPYGDNGTDPRRTGEALRRAGYRAAFRYKGGVARLPAQDPYHLPRLAMGPDTDLRAELGDR
ncbi:MAG: polysaccharide deacetylase family protein [Rubrobacteraceae bacterium]